MYKRTGIILFAGLFIMFFGFAFAEGTDQPYVPVAQEPAQAPAPAAAPGVAAQAEAQWLWGEVTVVNPAAKEITVKYLDYDTDTEKEMTVAADDKTSYENVKGIDEIKQKDTVSIDYAVSAGKNTAKNISVEKVEMENQPKGEVMEEVPQAVEETVKQKTE